MDNVKKLLGARIKELRLKKRLSQEQLAEMVNLDRRSISNIECGNTFPSSSLILIAKSLGVNIGALFEFNCINKTKTQIIKTITNALPDLTLEQLKIIARLIEIM